MAASAIGISGDRVIEAVDHTRGPLRRMAGVAGRYGLATHGMRELELGDVCVLRIVTAGALVSCKMSLYSTGRKVSRRGTVLLVTFHA